jgi:hypothetical protein
MIRDTSTGLSFEKKVHIQNNGLNLSKYNLYSYLKKKGVDWSKYLSKRLLPDEAYLDEDSKIFIVYEKKYQQTPGSADEKPQTCAFKIHQFKKLMKSIGVENVKYIYIFNDWFKKPEYKDMLEYIKSVEGCDYLFEEDLEI